MGSKLGGFRVTKRKKFLTMEVLKKDVESLLKEGFKNEKCFSSARDDVNVVPSEGQRGERAHLWLLLLKEYTGVARKSPGT